MKRRHSKIRTVLMGVLLGIFLAVFLPGGDRARAAPAPEPIHPLVALHGTLFVRATFGGEEMACERPFDLMQRSKKFCAWNATSEGIVCSRGDYEPRTGDRSGGRCTISWTAKTLSDITVLLECERRAGGPEATSEKEEFRFVLPASGRYTIPYWQSAPAATGKSKTDSVSIEVAAAPYIPLPQPVILHLRYERVGPSTAGPGSAVQDLVFWKKIEAGRGNFQLDLPPIPSRGVNVKPSLLGNFFPIPTPTDAMILNLVVEQRLSAPSGPGPEGTLCSQTIQKRVDIAPGKTLRIDLVPLGDCGAAVDPRVLDGAQDRLYVTYEEGKRE